MPRDVVSELSSVRDAPPPDPEHMIKDQDFMRDLKRLRALREFLRQSEVQISKEGRDACAFGDLNLLQNGLGIKGRPPTRWEWDQVELRIQVIWDLLSESSRKRFILGEIPGWISPAILLLAAAALGALLWSMFMLTQDGFKTASLLPPYLIWLVALGAIGAVAFIGMNALSVQEDATFDLSNGRLITLRIALGALFGMVLSVAFGFQPFLDFMWGLVNPAVTEKGRDIAKLSQQALMLLLPFVLGFSTSLVIMVLNRCVESVQTFFGKPPTQVGETKRAPRQAARGGAHPD